MTTIPKVADEVVAAVPWLTVEQMIEVDRAMVGDYDVFAQSDLVRLQ